MSVLEQRALAVICELLEGRREPLQTPRIHFAEPIAQREILRRIQAEEERDAVRAALDARTEMHDEHKAELRHAIRERDAAIEQRDAAIVRQRRKQEHHDQAMRALRRVEAERDDKKSEFAQALIERNAARASAVEWANTPIHRLLAAYGMGRAIHLEIKHIGLAGWQISWTRVGTRVGAQHLRPWVEHGTLDEACTAAAEQIEAT